jgi:hypothetical protein
MSHIDLVWEQILSRDPELIRAIYEKLTMDEQMAVLKHLNIMISEKGWHPEQVKSAQAALKTLNKRKDNKQKGKRGKN